MDYEHILCVSHNDVALRVRAREIYETNEGEWYPLEEAPFFASSIDSNYPFPTGMFDINRKTITATEIKLDDLEELTSIVAADFISHVMIEKSTTFFGYCNFISSRVMDYILDDDDFSHLDCDIFTADYYLIQM